MENYKEIISAIKEYYTAVDRNELAEKVENINKLKIEEPLQMPTTFEEQREFLVSVICKRISTIESNNVSENREVEIKIEVYLDVLALMQEIFAGNPNETEDIDF